jgi:hypothetical protein
MPALVKAGFTTQDQQIGEVEKLTSRNSAEAAALLGIRPGNVERTAAAIKRSDTLNDATVKIGDNDPLAATAKVEAGMGNLAAAFGGPFIPSITGGLSNLAEALNWTASLTKPHIGPDGKPEMLDHPEGSWDATKDFASYWKDKIFGKQSSGSHVDVYDAPAHAAMSHDIIGRDPRSPSTGPFAYTPVVAPPPAVTLQPGETVTGNQPITSRCKTTSPPRFRRSRPKSWARSGAC